jgi:predicted aspartyl protease
MKLARDVTIKICRTTSTVTLRGWRGFKREAQLLAALNHPHIAQVYGFEDSTDVRAPVMQLVGGPTRADRERPMANGFSSTSSRRSRRRRRPLPLSPTGQRRCVDSTSQKEVRGTIQAMGLTVLSVDVANPSNPDTREAVDFLVDSGAVYSFVSRDVLTRLGIVPHSRQSFRLADGSTIERDRGDALFFYRNHRGAAPVIFGEPGDATLLGAVTLESLGFVLDAVRRDLMPLPMVVAGSPTLR